MISVDFLKVGQFAHDALAELYSPSGDFVKRTSFATNRQSAQNEKIGSQRPLIGLLADGTWVPMATVPFAAVTGAVLAAWMAVQAKGKKRGVRLSFLDNLQNALA